jgi:hypothetical protein
MWLSTGREKANGLPISQRVAGLSWLFLKAPGFRRLRHSMKRKGVIEAADAKGMDRSA